MARFFFHFRQNGVLHADESGIDYPSTEDAYLAAMEAIPGMWGELLSQRQDPLGCAFEIHDQAGVMLFTVPFREMLEACHGGDAAQHAARRASAKVPFLGTVAGTRFAL